MRRKFAVIALIRVLCSGRDVVESVKEGTIDGVQVVYFHYAGCYGEL